MANFEPRLVNDSHERWEVHPVFDYIRNFKEVREELEGNKSEITSLYYVGR